MMCAGTLQYNKLESQMAEAEASWARELAQAATNVDNLNGQLEEAKRAYEETVSEVSRWRQRTYYLP